MKKRLLAGLILLCLMVLPSISALAEKTAAERFWDELEAYRVISDVPTAFEAKTWKAYNNAGKALRNMNPDELSEKDITKLVKVEEAHRALIQVAEIQYCCLIFQALSKLRNKASTEFAKNAKSPASLCFKG